MGKLKWFYPHENPPKDFKCYYGAMAVGHTRTFYLYGELDSHTHHLVEAVTGRHLFKGFLQQCREHAERLNNIRLVGETE